MSEPFIAEIRIFAGNFAPRGWAFCDGQLLPVSQNTALFSLIGTTYGGDGRTTTALPNMQGRAPMHPGRGAGLTSRRLGQRGGIEMVTLSESQMTQHRHTARAVARRGEENNPNGNYWAATVGNNTYIAPDAGGNPPSQTSFASQALESAGGSVPHNNMQPFITINFIIALVGLYPSRG